MIRLIRKVLCWLGWHTWEFKQSDVINPQYGGAPIYHLAPKAATCMYCKRTYK